MESRKNYISSLKSFVLPLILLEGIIAVIILINVYLGRSLSLIAYQNTMNIIAAIFGVIAVLFAISGIMAVYIFKKKATNMFTNIPTNLALRVVLPFVIFVADVFKINKTGLLKFYIDLNNIYVHSKEIKVSPEKVIIILPHCLHNSACTCKVTNDIKNCVKCGKCCIGQIRETAEAKNVKAFVATGGTAARSIISQYRPSIVVPIACERDLASGISDMKKVPAIGILNTKPNGPCKDTHVDVELLKKELDRILEK